MRLLLILLVSLLLFTSGCTYLNVDQAVYRDIRRCNDKIDRERLEHPEWNKNYEECMPLTTILRF